ETFSGSASCNSWFMMSSRPGFPAIPRLFFGAINSCLSPPFGGASGRFPFPTVQYVFVRVFFWTLDRALTSISRQHLARQARDATGKAGWSKGFHDAAALPAGRVCRHRLAV